MPIELNGQTYYRTSEARVKTGISRATLFRWLKAGLLRRSHRDRRGWRLFTEEDLSKIQAEASRIKVEMLNPDTGRGLEKAKMAGYLDSINDNVNIPQGGQDVYYAETNT
jgi:DNA-binding transcriptional MerR regulator